MALEIGSRLGHYDVTALIGEGGMGQVYQATDTKLNRQVALKILPEAFASDPDRLARFQREAQVLASLNHPNIAAIHGLEDSEGTKALVLELVEGPTLADRIAQGPIPIDEALPIAKQMAEALEAAHEAGVIHRDLKPANIKVKGDGTVKVLDFGLAKAFQPDASDASMSMSPTISLTAAATQMGMVIGTAAYMAPEQARGKVVDKRADIFAFGVVLYEMVTGRRPFQGEDVSLTLAAVMTFEPDLDLLPETLSPTLKTYLLRCLAKDPKERLRDIGDVRLAMDGAFETTVSQQSVAVDARRFQVWQRPIPLALAGLVLAAMTGFAVWGLTRPAPPRSTRFAISTSPPPFVGDLQTPDVVISPDGTRVVYVTRGARGGQLHVRSLDQLDAVPLRGAERAVNPFISADGNWVGYWSPQDRTLRKVSIHGGPSTTLTGSDGIDGASWGADETIIFAMRETNTGLLRASSAAGGESEPLTMLEEGEIAHRWPEILPGGQAVLFTVVKGTGSENMEIAALKLDTGERIPLVPGGSNPHYAPTGHLIYAVDGTLLAVPFDLDRLAVTGDPVSVLEGVVTQASGVAQFSLSNDGALVYLGGTDPGMTESVLGWVDRGGQMTPLMQGDGLYQYPRLSPDGRQVALTIGGDTDTADVWLYDIERALPTRLTEAGSNYYPVWTPDGAAVTFGSNRSGILNLYEKVADGSRAPAEVLLEKSTLLVPTAWSPDGITLAYYEVTNTPTARDIWTLRRDGEASAFLVTEFDERSPRLSPDGQWIAYLSDQSGEDQVYVQPFPESGRVIPISTGGGMEPVWSRDGTELFFRDGDQMLAVEFETGTGTAGRPEVLFEGSYNTDILGVGNQNYDAAPDGRFLMIRRGEDSAVQITIVQNWFEELKRLVPVD
jgi:serine/threonine-protein kinase